MEAQLPEEKSKALAAIVEEYGASENYRFMLALVAAGTRRERRMGRMLLRQLEDDGDRRLVRLFRPPERRSRVEVIVITLMWEMRMSILVLLVAVPLSLRYLASWRMRQMREALLRGESSSSQAASLRFPRRQGASRLEPAGHGS